MAMAGGQRTSSGPPWSAAAPQFERGRLVERSTEESVTTDTAAGLIKISHPQVLTITLQNRVCGDIAFAAEERGKHLVAQLL